MTKHGFRHSIKSFFGIHIDHDKDEELKGTKIEMDHKVQKILKLLKEEDEDDKNALLGLIEDFHKHYQSVYDRYDHLTGELREKVHGKKGNNNSSSSSSDSDSDYSTKDNGSKNGKLHHKVTDVIREKLQTANTEIVDLKTKLKVALEEKEALDSKYQVALNKIQETEDKKSSLLLEKESNAELGAIISQLEDEKEVFRLQLEDVKGKLKSTEEEASNLKHAVDDSENEKISLVTKITELSSEIQVEQEKTQEFVAECAQLREKLAVAEGEIFWHTEMHAAHTREATARIRALEEESVLVYSQKREIEIQKEEELSILLKKHEEKERDLLSHIEQLKENVCSLELEAESLQGQKTEAETQLEQKLLDISEYLIQVETLGQELASKTENEQKLLKAREEYIIQLRNYEQELQSLENVKTESEMEIQKKTLEVSESLVQIESLKEELANRIADQERVLEEKIGYMAKVKDLELEIKSLQDQKLETETGLEKKNQEISEFLTQIKSLNDELASKKLEHVRALEDKEGFFTKVNDLELELATLITLKFELEKQIENKNNENLQLQETLQGQILELEKTLVERGNELSKLVAVESDASAQVLALTGQVNSLQEEINSLTSLNNESEFELGKRVEEISEPLIQIKNLKEELASEMADKEKMMEEKEALAAEVDSLKNQKSEIEEQVFNKDQEIDRLRKENEGLQRKFSELVSSLRERDENIKAIKNEGSAQIEALSDKLNSLQGEKNELELLIEIVKLESLESLTEMKNKNLELASRVEDQERLIKSLEGDLSKLNKDHRQLEAAFEECQEKLQVKEHRVDQLQETVEDLKRDIETKGDEVSNRIETMRNLEVKVRLSNQKLRITEQLLNEKEDDYTSKEEKFQHENKSLLEKISVLYGITSSRKEDEGRVMIEISEKVNSFLDGMDALTVKFEEEYGHIEICIYEIMNEIQVVKSWVKEVNSERQQLKHNVQDKIEQELVLREKVGKLTAELIKGEAETKNLKKIVKGLEEKNGELENAVNEKDYKMREFEKLVNEKNERILCLGEEKREVIRQLCIWSDYQRDHYNYLKEILSRKTRGPAQVSR